MHLSEILKAELDSFRAAHTMESLDILETGSIRGTGANYQKNDGWSTLTFAEYAKKHGGSFTSIDLDTTAAETVLGKKGLRSQVNLIQGHSIEVLTGLVASAWASAEKTNKGEVLIGGDGFLDVAFLDSDNDGALIFHEYLVVKSIMRTPGLIIVDDVDVMSTEVVKGHEILPWAKRMGIAHRVEIRHGDGYQTGVLVFEV